MHFTISTMDESCFYEERAPWPFVHATVPLLLYFVTRNATLSLLLLFFWETLETVLSFASDFFVEEKPNSLIGDPLVGALTIMGFFFLDIAFRWREPFTMSVSPWLRFATFATVGLASAIVIIDGDGDSGSWLSVGLLIFGLVYLGLVLAFFNRIIFRWRTSMEQKAGHSALVLIGVVALLLIVAAPRFSSDSLLSSVFLRVVIVEAIFFVVALEILFLSHC